MPILHLDMRTSLGHSSLYCFLLFLICDRLSVCLVDVGFKEKARGAPVRCPQTPHADGFFFAPHSTSALRESQKRSVSAFSLTWLLFGSEPTFLWPGKRTFPRPKGPRAFEETHLCPPTRRTRRTRSAPLHLPSHVPLSSGPPPSRCQCGTWRKPSWAATAPGGREVWSLGATSFEPCEASCCAF